MTKPKILVTSAGGKTGLATALQLREKGFPVRALVRREDHRSRLLRNVGAEVFVGDMQDVRDLRESLKGVQRAYLCAPFGPNTLYISMAFAVAAQEARLETVTLLSQWLPHPGHASLNTREHWLAEQIMPWMPGVDTVVVNPGLFADTYFLAFAPVAQLGMLAMPLGEGRNAPPSNEDIARVVVGTLVNPAPHIGKSYRPTGPQLLTPHHIVEIFAKVLGRPVKFMDVPIKMFLKAATAQGFPPYEISQVRYYLEEHQRDAFAIGAPTEAVLEVGGREPEDFETITRRYVAERPEAVRSLGNKFAALGGLVKMILTRAPDMDAYERRRDHVLLRDPVFAGDSPEWRAVHDPAQLDQKTKGHLAQNSAA